MMPCLYIYGLEVSQRLVKVTADRKHEDISFSIARELYECDKKR